MLLKKRKIILSLFLGAFIMSQCNSDQAKTKEQENAEKRVKKEKGRLHGKSIKREIWSRFILRIGVVSLYFLKSYKRKVSGEIQIIMKPHHKLTNEFD